jgi:hypothetical protein
MNRKLVQKQELDSQNLLRVTALPVMYNVKHTHRIGKLDSLQKGLYKRYIYNLFCHWHAVKQRIAWRIAFQSARQNIQF